MVKTRRNKANGNTRKNINTNKSSSSILLKNFQREIVIKFLEIVLMIKLYHWKTYSYATHKATDELYGKLNGHMDRFIEILLGKTDKRTNLMNVKSIKLMDLDSAEQLKLKIDNFKSYLVNLNNNKAMNLMGNMDLLTVRDEILGDLNQFLYLLTFK
jgi:DNA-binding ferritin-like protein